MRSEVTIKEVINAKKILEDLYGDDLPDEIKLILQILENEEDLISFKSILNTDNQLDEESKKLLQKCRRLECLSVWISDDLCLRYSEDKRKFVMDSEKSTSEKYDSFEAEINMFVSGMMKIERITSIIM